MSMCPRPDEYDGTGIKTRERCRYPWPPVHAHTWHALIATRCQVHFRARSSASVCTSVHRGCNRCLHLPWHMSNRARRIRAQCNQAGADHRSSKPANSHPSRSVVDTYTLAGSSSVGGVDEHRFDVLVQGSSDAPQTYARSPRMRRASWMSLGMMVTRLAWMAHKLVSSKRPTK